MIAKIHPDVAKSPRKLLAKICARSLVYSQTSITCLDLDFDFDFDFGLGFGFDVDGIRLAVAFAELFTSIHVSFGVPH